jgi:hypothetical protein
MERPAQEPSSNKEVEASKKEFMLPVTIFSRRSTKRLKRLARIPIPHQSHKQIEIFYRIIPSFKIEKNQKKKNTDTSGVFKISDYREG